MCLAQDYRLERVTGPDFSHGTIELFEQAHLHRQGFLLGFCGIQVTANNLPNVDTLLCALWSLPCSMSPMFLGAGFGCPGARVRRAQCILEPQEERSKTVSLSLFPQV